jgi:CTD small phosphatase-like protein 2
MFKGLPIEIVLQVCSSTLQKSRNIESLLNFPSIFSMILESEGPSLPVYSRPKFTLVLDLDETLGHYSQQKFLLRPGVHQFIDMVSKSFELVLFTAARSDYADWAMKLVDPQCKIFLRLYSQHTTDHVFKDLDKLGRDLEKVIIVDNYSKSFEKHPLNGVLIRTWTGDEKDFELARLGEKLSEFIKSGSENIREFVFKNNRC